MKTKKLNLVMFIAIIGMLVNSCAFLKGTGSTASNNNICMNYNNIDPSQLPVALVHDMVDGYRDYQLKKINLEIIKNGISLDDARSIWFPLTTLKKFLYDIENETLKIDGDKSDEQLGVRIYYARYPSKVDSGWVKREYDGVLDDFGKTPETAQYDERHTLVMIPTRREDSLNIDFNPLDRDTYNTRLKSEKLSNKYSRDSQIGDKKKQYILAIGPLSSPNPNPGPGSSPIPGPGPNLGSDSSFDIFTNAQNHGSLIPPRDTNLNEEGFGS